MGKVYRAALVGLGNIAWRFATGPGGESLSHAAAYRRQERTELVGGCSPRSDDRKTFRKDSGLPAFESMEELVEATKPDIVSICSPAEAHREQVEHCLEREVPMVWLEKPPVRTVGELDSLIGKRRERGNKTVVLVNYLRRYMDCYRGMRDLLMSDRLGVCRHVAVHYSRGLEENGSHMMDALFFLLGEEMRCELEWVSGPAARENPSFALSTAQGVEVLVHGMELPYHCIDLSLVCEQGRATVLHGGMTTVLERPVSHELFPGFFRLSESPDELPGKAGLGACLDEALRDLIAAAEGGTTPASSLETARKTQVLLEKVREEQKRNRR